MLKLIVLVILGIVGNTQSEQNNLLRQKNINILFGERQSSGGGSIIGVSPNIDQNSNRVLISNSIYKGNCSSVYCNQCLNQYICSSCQYNQQPICCPRFCSKCLDINNCIECDKFFVLQEIKINNIVTSTICARISQYTDPYLAFITGVGPSCMMGYYLQIVTQSCLPSYIPNCNVSSAYMQCSTCMNGFYLWNNYTYNNQTFVESTIPQCLPCMSFCMNCTNQFACLNCAVGYFYENNLCYQCQSQYCVQCNADADRTCSQCIDNAYIYNASYCVLCENYIENCTQCYTQLNSSLVCTACKYGYLQPQANTCTPCTANCLVCVFKDQLLICNGCVQFYTHSNDVTTCIPCGLPGCLACQNLLIYYPSNYQPLISCDICMQNYTLVSTSTSSQVISTCVKCLFPCNGCFVNSICQQCAVGFYVNFQLQNGMSASDIGQCYFCNLTNCLGCKSADNCLSCTDGYYLIPAGLNGKSDTSQTICAQCPSSCSTCILNSTSINSTLPICIICLSGYYVSNGACLSFSIPFCQSAFFSLGVISCSQCIPGYYKNFYTSQQQCQLCNMQNCLRCQLQPLAGQVYCMECQSGYFITNQYSSTPCQKCGIDNCLYCALTNGNFSCSRCVQGYYPVVNNSSESNLNQICIQCPDVCLECNSNGCTYCSKGYYLAQQSSNAQQSPNGQQSSLSNNVPNVICLICDSSSGCLQCFNSQYCKLCTSLRYAPTPTIYGNCSQCPADCLQCDSSLTCSLCDVGFLINYQTNECLNQTGFPIWSVFSLAIFGGALLLVLVQKIYRELASKRHQALCIKEQHKRQNYQNQQELHQMVKQPQQDTEFLKKNEQVNKLNA